LASARRERGDRGPVRGGGGARRTQSSAKQPATAEHVLRWLERRGKRSTVEGMARYGIPSDGADGVTVGELRVFA